MRMVGVAVAIFLSFVLASLCSTVRSWAGAVVAGPGAGVVVEPTRTCSSGTLIFEHDGSFENAYAWTSQAACPFPFGSWGEAYDMGPGVIRCASYWLTRTHEYDDLPADLLVWDEGAGSEPGAVLFTLPGQYFHDLPFWPEVAQRDVTIDFTVQGPFTIGFWADWGCPWSTNTFFVAADEDGPVGNAWSFVNGEIYPPGGWQQPAGWPVPFAECKSLGLGCWSAWKWMRRP